MSEKILSNTHTTRFTGKVFAIQWIMRNRKKYGHPVKRHHNCVPLTTKHMNKPTLVATNKMINIQEQNAHCHTDCNRVAQK